MPDFNLLDELRHTGYGIASGLDALVGFYNKTLQGFIQRSPILSPSALGVCILNTKTREINLNKGPSCQAASSLGACRPSLATSQTRLRCRQSTTVLDTHVRHKTLSH